MTTTTFRAVALICLVAGRVLSQSTAASHTSARSNGFVPDRLARVDTFLQSYVDSNRIAGAVALVVRDGNVVYERAVGWADKESRRRMTTDAMFRIASQSKALTSIAIMMLVEEGRIALGNPVSRFIPAYAHTMVATRGDTGRVLVPANHAITIKELLTHTAGISYGTDSLVRPLYAAQGLGTSAGYGWYTADKNEPICTTMERLASLPFVKQPGEAFVYGYNTDILGCVVERASGMSLDEFFRKRITGPLGMKDTYFFVPESRKQQLVTVYASDSTQRSARAPEGPRGQGHYVTGPRRSFSGGAGLVSTARDYARLLQMLLNGGQLDGVRLLSPKTVDVMTTNQVGSLYEQGVGFGLGFSVVQWPGADNTLLSEGTYGWGGAYGSQYRVDPRERIVLVFMLNQLPNSTDIGQKFPTIVYQALTR